MTSGVSHVRPLSKAGMDFLRAVATINFRNHLPGKGNAIMPMKTGNALRVCAAIFVAGCSAGPRAPMNLVDEPFADRQSEIREAILSIESDIESGNIEGLQAAHLDSEKFTKFGPRNFERQDVTSTNASEAAFFGSIDNPEYEIRDLKIDVFGDVGVATYYPEISFSKDGRDMVVSGRQTFVFLRTDAGWKLVHEHGTVRRP